MTVAILEDDDLKTGQLQVIAEIVEGKFLRVGAVVLPDGRRVPLGDDPVVIGRLPDCAIPIGDPQASRRHAEIRPHGDGYVVADQGSMNGTMVNAPPDRRAPAR